MNKNIWFEMHEGSFEEDLASLVAVPSVSPDPENLEDPNRVYTKEVFEKVTALLHAYRITSEISTSDRYLTARVPGNGKSGKTMGVFCHLDVLPEGNRDLWLEDPFKLHILDGYYIGRGVADNKGSTLTIIYVLRYLAEEGISLDYDILLFFGAYEENGMHCLKEYLHTHEEPDFGFTPDADFPICIGEKDMVTLAFSYDLGMGVLRKLSAGTVSNAVPGEAEATIQVTPANRRVIESWSDESTDKFHISLSDSLAKVKAYGTAGHAAFPEDSENALVMLCQGLLKKGIYDEKSESLLKAATTLWASPYGDGFGIAYQHELFGKLTAVATLGQTQEGRYEQQMDLRMPPTLGMENTISVIARESSEFGLTSKVLRESKSKIHNPEQPWIHKMEDLLERYYPGSFENKLYTMGGGTYARLLTNCVGYGPGKKLHNKPEVLGGGHQENEAISREELVQAFLIYTDFLTEVNK